MDGSRLALDDQKLLEFYATFQKTRRALGEIYPGARYDDFVERGKYRGTALRVTMTAYEQIISVGNVVNRFCYDLHGLTAWEEVLDAMTEDEKIAALFEFVSPIVDRCLSSPYSTKQMFIKSICHISHQTARFCTAGWSDSSLEPDKRLDFKEAERLAVRFHSWPALCAALSRLNDGQFVVSSDDYRNRLHHGFQRHVEFGHTMTFLRDPDSPSYTFYDASPLRLCELIPALANQYEAALSCYYKYIYLIKEQSKTWPAVVAAI